MASTPDARDWVAIIDDDEFIRRSLARLLQTYGIEGRTFHSAEDYLSRAAGTPVCICLDLSLGDGMNGIGLSEHLRVQAVSVPIIIITGQDKPELGPAATNANVAAVLRKPLDSGQLLDCVMRYAAVYSHHDLAMRHGGSRRRPLRHPR